MYKFFVLEEIGYILSSFIFTCCDSIFVISLVLPLEKLDDYLPSSQLCIGRMRSLIKKLQAILKKQGT